MTTANLVDHEPFCLPRPGELEPRIEAFSVAVSDAAGAPLGRRDVVRCQECGSETVDGRQIAT